MSRRQWLEEQRPEPRRTRPFGGIDHGSQGTVLVELRRGNEVSMRLVWFKGHMTASAGVRGFGHHYSPATLRVIGRIGLTDATLLEGGRLSRSRMKEKKAEIDGLFGEGVVEAIEIGRTLTIVEEVG